MAKYSKNALNKATRATGLKSAKLEQGAKLAVLAVILSEETTDQLNLDSILCLNQATGKKIRVPMREFANMNVEGGKLINDGDTGSGDEGNLPKEIHIVSSTDRKDRDGKTVYPIQAYKAGAEQIKAGVFDYAALIASGPANGVEFQGDPVQDYTISVVF